MKRAGPQKTILTLFAALILLVIATSPLTSLLVIRHVAKQIVDDSIVGLAAAGEASINISDGLLETSLALSTTNSVDAKTFADRVAVGTAETDRQLERYKPSINDSTDRANFDALVKRRTEYRAIRTQVFDLLAKNRHDEATAMFHKQCLPAYSSYLQALSVVVKFNSQEASNRGNEILKLTKGMLILQSLLVVFFIVYAFWIPALTLYERMTRRAIED